MPLFRRRTDTRLVSDLTTAVRDAACSGVPEPDPRGVLATAAGPDCAVVLTRTHLAVRRAWPALDDSSPGSPADADAPDAAVVETRDNPAAVDREPADDRSPADKRHATWRWWPWQQVQGGSWAGESRRLVVTLLDGGKVDLTLDNPGEVPAVFAERVQSSILVEEHVRVPGGEVVVSGRRAPVAADHEGRRSPVVWHALAVGAVDLRRPEVSARVVAATQRLSADYDLG